MGKFQEADNFSTLFMAISKQLSEVDPSVVKSSFFYSGSMSLKPEECQALLETNSSGKQMMRPVSSEMGEASKRTGLGSLRNSTNNLMESA